MPVTLWGVDVGAHLESVARAAAGAAPALARADAAALDAALRGVAAALREQAPAILEANGRDVRAAEGSLSGAVLDRLRLDAARLEDIARQVEDLAALPPVSQPRPATWGRATGCASPSGGCRWA